jgi:hypothetical protein
MDSTAAPVRPWSPTVPPKPPGGRPSPLHFPGAARIEFQIKIAALATRCIQILGEQNVPPAFSASSKKKNCQADGPGAGRLTEAWVGSDNARANARGATQVMDRATRKRFARILDGWNAAAAMLPEDKRHDPEEDDIESLVRAISAVLPDVTRQEIDGALEWDFKRRARVADFYRQRASRLYLQALIKREMAEILLSAGLGKKARIADCLTKLGYKSDVELEIVARDRVLDRLSWRP